MRLLPGGRRGKLVFGVMGSAAPESTIARELRHRLSRLGSAIAKRKGVVLTGACPGMPQVAARAAKKAGGMTAGISPAGSLAEHVHKFRSPTEALDVIQMTGAGPGMGFIAREKQNIQYSDILVFAGGRSGTLGEMVFAMQERKVIALLEDSTGVTAKALSRIIPHTGRGRAVIVADRDPQRLINKAVRAHEKLTRSRTRRTRRGRVRRSNAGGLRQLGAALTHRTRSKRERVPMRRKPVITDALRRAHNVYAFFGSKRQLTKSDRGKVERLVELLAADRTGGRAPVLVAPTRGGLSSQVARTADARGVFTVGISPAWSRAQHKKRREAVRGFDVVRLTGEGRGAGRLAAYQHAIEKADVVFVAGGDERTLGGTVFAMYQPTVVAVLETAKGMSGKLRTEILTTFDKPAHAKMIFDSDPARLVRRAVKAAAALRKKARTEYIAPE